MWSLFRRRWRATELRVKSRAEHLSGVHLDHFDAASLSPEPPVVLASVVYQQFIAYQRVSSRLREIPDVDTSMSVAAVGAEMYRRYARLRRAWERTDGRQDSLTAMISRPADILAAFSSAPVPTWQEELVAVYATLGILDDAGHGLLQSRSGLPGVFFETIGPRHADDMIVDLLNAQVESGEFPRDVLALCARTVVGDALLAVRSCVVLPDEARAEMRAGHGGGEGEIGEAIAQWDAFQSQLVAAHSLRMDAMHLTA